VTLLGHAFGQRYDLPVPLWLFVVGGAAVVLVSFFVVLPRPVAAAAGGGDVDVPGPQPHAPVRSTLAVVGLTAVAVVGWTGSQAVAENIVPTLFWLVIWVLVPVTVGIIGDWTRPVNPFATLARLLDRPGLRAALLGEDAPLPWSPRAGSWPAVVLFFVVACGELIFNSTATLPAVTATGLVVYALISAVMGLLVGAPAWIERGELFSVLFATWGRLGFFRFGAPGRNRLGGGLQIGFEPTVSRITFVLLLLTSVSFDGLSATGAWKSLQRSLPSALTPGTAGYLVFDLAAFVGLTLLVWFVFAGFSALVRRAGGLEASTLRVLAGLLPSLLPIAFGYLVAHNAEYLAINGQLLVPLLGNPGGYPGVHLLPRPFDDSYEINPNLVPSAVVWYLQVALIIFVHICAVVLAHHYLGRAARTAPQARRSEAPWIVAMVGYTMTSLWLLAQPIVQEGAAAAWHVVTSIRL
jgi:hypothetical protein